MKEKIPKLVKFIVTNQLPFGKSLLKPPSDFISLVAPENISMHKYSEGFPAKRERPSVQKSEVPLFYSN